MWIKNITGISAPKISWVHSLVAGSPDYDVEYEDEYGGDVEDEVEDEVEEEVEYED